MGTTEQKGMAWFEEQENLTHLETDIDHRIASLRTRKKKNFDTLRNDTSEDQEKWKVHSDINRDNDSIDQAIANLAEVADEPYFGRFDLSSEAGNETFYLGKTAPVVDIGINIFPWFANTDFIDALYYRYRNTDVSDFDANGYHYSINLKRQITIKNGVLYSVNNAYSRDGKYDGEITDSFLIEVLEHHHKDSYFVDIISSIQEKQYNIIRAPHDENILVQGCAGSGKTQIMLHRLSYLLQSKKPVDWGNARIITGNPMFHYFARALMRELALSELKCLSIADYMSELLLSIQKLDQTGTQSHTTRYEVRNIEASLPVEYLQEVNNINFQETLNAKIPVLMRLRLAEIEHEHPTLLQKLGMTYKQDTTFSQRVDLLSKKVNELIPTSKKRKEQEQAKIKIEEIEIELGEAQQQRKKRALEIDIHQQWTEILEKTITASRPIIDEINNHRSELKTIHEKFDEAKAQAEHEWKQSLAAQMKLGQMSSKEQIECAQKHITATQKRASYAEGGESYQAYLSEVQAYEAIIKELVDTLPLDEHPTLQAGNWEEWVQNVTDDYAKSKRVLQAAIEAERLAEEKVKHLEERLHLFQQEINKLSEDEIKELELISRKLKSFPQQVFERDMLPHIDSVKEQYNIPLRNSKKKRILYKIELELYIQVYLTYFGELHIPQNSLLCIDEAQDLTSMEYLILSILQPDAKYNLFGDIEQQLYPNIGLNSWDDLTVPNLHIHKLAENYRNAAAISEFCSKQCNIPMKAFGIDGYVGIVSNNTLPLLFPWIEENRETVAFIIKDVQAINQLKLPTSLKEKLYIVDQGKSEPSDSLINVYTLEAAKGLEFPTAFIIEANMSRQQQYVAYTRAMKRLIRVTE